MATTQQRQFTEDDWREINQRVRQLLNDTVTLSDIASEFESHGEVVEQGRNGKYIVLDGDYKRYSLYQMNNGNFALTDMYKMGELGTLTGSKYPDSAYGIFNIMKFVGVDTHKEVEEIFLGLDARKNVIQDYSEGKKYEAPERKPSTFVPTSPKPETRKELVMPELNDKARVAFGYLTKTRGIDYQVVKEFVKRGDIVEDKEHHNVGFVGKDENDKPAYLQFRVPREVEDPNAITRWNVSGSQKKYSFRKEGNSGWVYVFESPIDMLSYLTLNPEKEEWKKKNTYLSMGGVDGASLRAYLDRNEAETTHIVFCLDNDEAGKKAINTLSAEIKKNNPNIKIARDLPTEKDWNEELLALKENPDLSEVVEEPKPDDELPF